MLIVFEVRFYTTAAGRSQPRSFLEELPSRDRMLIAADIEALRVHGLNAPISTRTIKGKQNRGLAEIRTGNFRTFYCMKRGIVWLLHICKKEHQERGIEAARARMETL
jgi:mRNA-degrading endonuclease RelE of RelBE toxin-antitoxin system